MRSDMWRRVATRYVAPHLPGEWKTGGALLYRVPAEWLLCGLLMSNVATSKKFRVSAVVQLLAVPRQAITGPHLLQLGHGTGRGIWDAPATVADSEPAMREVLRLAEREALPLLDKVGNLPGFAADAAERAQNAPMNVHYQEALFTVRLIGSDVPGALHAANDVHEAIAARGDVPPWANEVSARVSRIAEVARQSPVEALALLRNNADQTRSALSLV